MPLQLSACHSLYSRCAGPSLCHILRLECFAVQSASEGAALPEGEGSMHTVLQGERAGELQLDLDPPSPACTDKHRRSA